MPIEYPAIQLLVQAAFGMICALIASGRGRSALGWFFLGFFLHCFAIIILLVIPDLNAEEGHRRQLEMENRRLRERVRKDRMVSDQRYHHTLSRLSSHDHALGMDTSAGVDELDAFELPPPTRSELLEAAGYGASQWFYVAESQREGPVSFQELQRHWRDARIDASTLIWRESMTDWAPVAEVAHLKDLLSA